MVYQIFKLPFHRLKRTNFLLNLAEAFPTKRDDLIHLGRLAQQWTRHSFECAMKIKKLPDFGKGKPDFVVAADEQYAIEIALAVVSISGGGARRSWKQLLPFIKTDSLDIYAGRTS